MFILSASLMTQLVKNSLAVQETACIIADTGLILGLGRSDEMGTHSNILAWKIPWIEVPVGVQSMGSQESDTIYQLNHHHQWIIDLTGKCKTIKLLDVSTGEKSR